ncbi:MAG: DUF4433 domain-containing protein [Nitrospiraceae bacterium]|nr:DUF4433 domain-containing protein [Nitrospiraceae bacterium]
MTLDPAKIELFHITDVDNLPSILAGGRLLSDVALAGVSHQVIGYGHIKQRRMTEYRVPCCSSRFVGEFVPFYFCPRSPMLYTVNKGSTGKPPGCQAGIVHLVTTVAHVVALGHQWAVADGNAGAAHTGFRADLAALDDLDWQAIRARSWQGLTHQKSAEFLVADAVPWAAIQTIACYSADTAARVTQCLAQATHRPAVSPSATTGTTDRHDPPRPRQSVVGARPGAGQYREHRGCDGQGHRAAVPSGVPGHVQGLRRRFQGGFGSVGPDGCSRPRRIGRRTALDHQLSY